MNTIPTLALALLLAASACGAPPAPGAEFWRPWYDDPSQSSGVDGSADGSQISGGSCSLSVSVTTATLAGKYAPRNVGAIWVDDANNHFVKSLYVWGNRRITHLNRWVSETTAAGLPSNRVDAVSAATLSDFGVRTAQWNCTDASKKPVPSGSYHVCFEVTSSNAAGPNDCIPFNAGTGPFHNQPADTSEFQSMVLVMAP
jgi:hypothetical protein